MLGIVSIVFIILAVLSMGYFAFAASYAGIHSSFLGFWVLLGIVCVILAGVFSEPGKKHILSRIPHGVKCAIAVLFAAGVIFFIVLEGLVVSKMWAVPEGNVDYIVVLGAQVRGERITKSLAKRLDAAYDYATEHEDVVIIVSGGQGKGEDISEAAAMEKYLVEKGIDRDRIIKEDKSTSTKENIKFSKEKMTIDNPHIAVVTNNFHVYRAMKIANKAGGFESVQGLAGKSDNHLIINYMVREAFAIVKMMVGQGILAF